MSFEVAEHLEEQFADVFIDNITKLSDVVVFSAAIPQQGGTHHVNEQWASYWTEKFRKKGYKASDCLRKYFWEDASINPLRRQNIMLYVKMEKYDQLTDNFKMENEGKILDVVHPDFWLEKNSTSLQRIEELNSVCSTQYMMMNSIIDSDVKTAMKIIGEMNLFEMADNVKYLEYIKRHFPDYFLEIETEVDRVSKRMQNDRFILWGAGEDGKKVERLFAVLEKDIVKVCDKKPNGIKTVGIQEMLDDYNGEIVIISSRKYLKEIMEFVQKIDGKNRLIIYQSTVVRKVNATNAIL